MREEKEKQDEKDDRKEEERIGKEKVGKKPKIGGTYETTTLETRQPSQFLQAERGPVCQ